MTADRRSLGTLIRETREAKGLSLEDLATRVFVKPIVLYNIEEDLEARAPASALFFIAKELGLEYRDLLERGGHFIKPP